MKQPLKRLARVARACTLVLAIAGLGTAASRADAAKNTWAANNPATGDNNGEIKVSGTATADAGETLGETGFAVAWPVGADGGLVISGTVKVDAKTGLWSGTITGLQSGTNYWVVVQVTQGTQPIATEPKQQKAK